MSTDEADTTRQNTEAQFGQTHWSMVLSAKDKDVPGAEAALEKLCRSYWYPLYAFLRRQGKGPEEAEDLTQGFFVHLLAKDRLQSVHPAKGKFRSFLLACLTNYVNNQREKEQAAKRGGGQVVLSIDASDAEEHYRLEPVDVQDPAKLFERQWASMLIEEVLRQVKEQCASNGKPKLFDALHPFLTGDAERGVYASIATKLGMNEGAVRVAVTRLRNDFRELLFTEVARTVDDPAEVESEIRQLFSAFRSS